MRKNVSDSARLPHALHLLGHMCPISPLIALPATAPHTEATDPGDCARSNKALGVGKEQGQVR